MDPHQDRRVELECANDDGKMFPAAVWGAKGYDVGVLGLAQRDRCLANALQRKGFGVAILMDILEFDDDSLSAQAGK